MHDSITLTLPHEIIVKAQAWADQSGLALDEFLAESIESSLASFTDSGALLRGWTDEQVIERRWSESWRTFWTSG